jgi:hypothetical protein
VDRQTATWTLGGFKSVSQLVAVAGDGAAGAGGFARLVRGEPSQRQEAVRLDAAPERRRLFEGGDGQSPGAGFEGGPGDLLGAVAVAVRLDDGDQADS